MKNGWVVCFSLVQKDFSQTGTPLDAVPVPGAILTRSLQRASSQTLLQPSPDVIFPYWIIYSICFINDIDKLKG